MTIEVIELQLEDSDLKLFHQLHDALHQQGENVFPQRYAWLKKALMTYPEAQKIWLALQNSQVQARLVARVDAGVGYLGMFEAHQQRSAVISVLDTALDWFAKQGVYRVIGPLGFDYFNNHGFNLGPWRHQGFMLEPQQPQYYIDFWEDYGFSVHSDYYSRNIPNLDYNTTRLQHYYDYAIEQGFRFRPLRIHHFETELKKLYELHQLVAQEACLCPHEEAFILMCQRLKPLISPEFIQFVCNKEGQAIGYMLAMGNCVEAFESLNRQPYRLWKLARGRKKVDSVNLYALGILPSYHRQGLARALSYKLASAALKLGYQSANICNIKEGNPVDKMNQAAGLVFRRYRLYQYFL